MTAVLAFLVAWGGKLWAGIVWAWGWTRRHPVATPWIVCGTLAALLIVQHWDGLRRLKNVAESYTHLMEGQRDAAAAGLEVVQRKSQAEVDAQVAKIKDLQAAIDAAEAEVGRLTVKYVVHAETGGGKVSGGARPGEPRMDSGMDSLGPSLPPVVLREGDEVKGVVDGAVVEGKRGEETVHGFWEVFRSADGKSLSRQPFSAPVTVAVEGPKAVCPEVPKERQWRAGAVGGLSGQGWLGGVGATRRVDVFGWKPEVMGAAVGGKGQGVLVIGVLF